jgi:hypothetical protein
MHPQFGSTFENFSNMPHELRDGFWNYFAYGLEPGSFCTAVLCNNFIGAACSAHPSLSSATFRDMAKWLLCYAPANSWGSEEKVMAWCRKTDQERMDIMIECNIRPGEFDILAGRAVT